MKLVKTTLIAAALTLGASASHAYYFPDGSYVGKATIKGSGSCSTKSLVFKDAMMGNIHDENDGNAYVGWGIVSSSGELLAVYDNVYQQTAYKRDGTKKKSTWVGFEEYLSEPLVELIEGEADCSFTILAPDLASSLITYDSDDLKEVWNVSLKYNFDGFVGSFCTEPKADGSYTCKGGKAGGSITFKGKWQDPIM